MNTTIETLGRYLYWGTGGILLLLLLLVVVPWLLGVRYIPHTRVGVVEKLWSGSGSLVDGGIIALNGEAGYQTHILRGGVHSGFYPWQYRIHRQPLVTVSEGRIGYVYARDGSPLPPVQTLGHVVECNHFQDARAFLSKGGQRGRQRLILREGVYALNLALFVVITEDYVYSGPVRDQEATKYHDWQTQLTEMRGFDPVVIGYGSMPNVETDMEADTHTHTKLLPTDNLGVVSVQDGPAIESGDIIAPEVHSKGGAGHNNFQDPESFLTLGGKRGKQLQVLTDGTFFINRWFATVEIQPKTVIPIGYVGVVVSYHGGHGEDVTGQSFRYGEQVEHGQRGVWREALPSGKYALNPYALKVELVPTVNFVLRWITGHTELHRYDEGLTSIELVTADAYEPVLPLSLVLHIDYERASSVVQRFGDVKRLISQTLDPILTAYFRDVAQSSSMLDLLTKREEIQKHATAELGRR
ncbi:MAG TPA: SPFH domain-containing protein, partial [Chthoniobacterales bacterium]|nr:SPFH domain-containing protein [Chthoniobacterales bacterium]